MPTKPILGASQPSRGLALEGSPALILKLCSNLSGSRDFKYVVFKSSLRFIHDGFNVTAELENGKPFQFCSINSANTSNVMNTDISALLMYFSSWRSILIFPYSRATLFLKLFCSIAIKNYLF
jgi:hypothetical protein